jgi:hypothetical protein
MIKEPFILLSYINTKLRDEYSSLSDLASSTGYDELEIVKILKEIGYFYDEEQNAFIRRQL